MARRRGKPKAAADAKGKLASKQHNVSLFLCDIFVILFLYCPFLLFLCYCQINGVLLPSYFKYSCHVIVLGFYYNSFSGPGISFATLVVDCHLVFSA
jgi:hypothetical protein